MGLGFTYASGNYTVDQILWKGSVVLKYKMCILEKRQNSNKTFFQMLSWLSFLNNCHFPSMPWNFFTTLEKQSDSALTFLIWLIFKMQLKIISGGHSWPQVVVLMFPLLGILIFFGIFLTMLLIKQDRCSLTLCVGWGKPTLTQ